MNLELCQLNKVYYYNYMNYNKALNQRNTLLKQIAFQPSLKDTLDMWDMYLIEYGEKTSNIKILIHGKCSFGKR